MKKFLNIEDSLAYVRALPIDEVLKIAAESLVFSEIKQTPRITLTEEQFQAFFKIKGINDAGERETRGRKRKEI